MDVNIAGSDVVQRRRERDKARWHAMSQEKKDEKNKNVEKHIKEKRSNNCVLKQSMVV
jgi:hypothetical protein